MDGGPYINFAEPPAGNPGILDIAPPQDLRDSFTGVDTELPIVREALTAAGFGTTLAGAVAKQAYYRRRLSFADRGFLFGLIGFIAFFTAALCCCLTADTAALVHKPARRLVQLSIMLLGLPFICASSPQPMSAIAPHVPHR